MGQRWPTTSETANPNGRWRALSNSPPSSAPTGLPAASSPTAMNCEPPANTTIDITSASHPGTPLATAIAPNDTPMNAAAMIRAPMSRSSPRSMVR